MVVASASASVNTVILEPAWYKSTTYLLVPVVAGPAALQSGHRRAHARARRHAAGPAAATWTEQNPTHRLSAVVSPAAFWNSPRGQPAAATAYGATAETAVEGTAGGATASLAAATGAQ